jgi:hypothetical protein
MSIPSLTPDGLLPPGVHVTDLPEVGRAFGSSNPRRAALFQKLEQFIAVAETFALFKAVFIDGSFVTDKDAPGDIDAVLELPRTDLAKVLAHPKRLALLDSAAVKATYEVHLFMQPTPPVPPQLDMAAFFQRLKPEEAIVRKLPLDSKRGILRVAL